MKNSSTKSLVIYKCGLILFVILCVYSFLFGNPVFKIFATNTATAYLKENYTDCYIDSIDYTLVGIGCGYHAVVKSNTDEDFEEIIYMDISGLTVDEKMMNFLN